MEGNNIKNLRRDFLKSTINANTDLSSPCKLFSVWMQEAIDNEKILDANAFVLATSAKDVPDARVLLLRGQEEDNFTFFTNYLSNKAQELAQNPQAMMVFFWPELERQVRIKGVVKKVDASISDDYFASRPKQSQIAASISKQSQKLDSYADLIKQFQAELKNADVKPTRPDFWGGYNLEAHEYEFWQGGANRLHQRILYQKKDSNLWENSLLYP